MESSAYTNALCWLARQHPEEFKTLYLSFKKLHPAPENVSAAERDRYYAKIRYCALKELKEKYYEQYMKEVHRIQPSKRRYADKRWEIRMYEESIDILVHSKIVYTTGSLDLALKYIKDNS